MPDTPPLHPLVRRPGPFVLLALLALALGIYLPYALRAGWYYDDWALYSIMRESGTSWGQRFSACTHGIVGGRKLTCLYHATEYQLLGSHRVGYHLVSIGMLVLMAGLAYAILRRCRLAWPWAAGISALLIVFPGSDSTRLWPTASIGEYVVCLVFVGVLITLLALRRNGRWSGLGLHLLAALLSVVAMLTYEIAVPLVAFNGLVYWAAYRNRRALWRGVADLGIAAAFVGYRLTIAPVDPSSGFVVHRTLGGDLRRARAVLVGAWSTWHQAFLPGWLGLVGVVGVLLGAAAVFAWKPELRRHLLPWAALLVASIVVAGASALSFLTANDLYVPQLSGTFNRLNLPGSVAYAGVFVALLGLGYEIIRGLVPLRGLAVAAVSVVALGSAWHQLGVAADHKRVWEASWSDQQAALAGYRVAVRGLPSDARVVGMGAPLFEREFVPVFAATWDLQGAIDYTTAVNPPLAVPLVPALVCGPSGLILAGAPLTPYRVPNLPLYFISAKRRRAQRVDSQAGCDSVISRWGRPPFWGRSVTG